VEVGAGNRGYPRVPAGAGGAGGNVTDRGRRGYTRRNRQNLITSQNLDSIFSKVPQNVHVDQENEIVS